MEWIAELLKSVFSAVNLEDDLISSVAKMVGFTADLLHAISRFIFYYWNPDHTRDAQILVSQVQVQIPILVNTEKHLSLTVGQRETFF